MRPLEIALWAVSASALLWRMSRPASGWDWILVCCAAALLILHALLEGPRWHLGPMYFLVFCLVVDRFLFGRLALGPGLSAFAFVLLAVTAILGSRHLVPQLAKPTGTFAVGTVVLHLVDEARKDPRTTRPDGRRELMAQVWYPADAAGPKQPYRTAAETTFLTSHLTLISTNAAADVPVARAQTRYPIVFFAPSWGGGRADNTVQVEELASHGFVVVGIDHPFGSDRVVFPDGRTARTVLTEFLAYESEESLHRTETIAEEELRTRVADVRFVFDEVERLDRDDPAGILNGRLDLTRAGVFGFSFGGAVSAETCRVDPRLSAAVNIDGFMFGEASRAGVAKPFVIVSDDMPIPTAADVDNARNDSVRRRYRFLLDNLEKMRNCLADVNGHYIRVRGTRHADYSDADFHSPAPRSLSRIRQGRATEILNAYLLSFFRKHLKGEDDGLLDAPSPYQEVEIERLSKSER